MEYKIIESEATERLAFLVNDAIKEGWEPQGGVTIAFDTESAYSLFAAQAMVRK